MGNIVSFYTKEDNKMLDILDVARYFLSLGSMKHKKLQKLCFYAQSWYITLAGKRLMDTEFEAWVHGPVSPRLYEYYREWGLLTISQIPCPPSVLDRLSIYIGFLNEIYEIYKDYTADQLEELTHSETPWITARGNLNKNDPCENVISDEVISQYYGGLINNG